MLPSVYNIGDRVHRIENREVTGAIIGAIILDIVREDGENFILLLYDEGGTGWWPESAIRHESSIRH